MLGFDYNATIETPEWKQFMAIDYFTDEPLPWVPADGDFTKYPSVVGRQGEVPWIDKNTGEVTIPSGQEPPNMDFKLVRVGEYYNLPKTIVVPSLMDLWQEPDMRLFICQTLLKQCNGALAEYRQEQAQYSQEKTDIYNQHFRSAESLDQSRKNIEAAKLLSETYSTLMDEGRVVRLTDSQRETIITYQRYEYVQEVQKDIIKDISTLEGVRSKLQKQAEERRLGAWSRKPPNSPWSRKPDTGKKKYFQGR